jgi:hypothetical protein
MEAAFMADLQEAGGAVEAGAADGAGEAGVGVDPLSVLAWAWDLPVPRHGVPVGAGATRDGALQAGATLDGTVVRGGAAFGLAGGGASSP